MQTTRYLATLLGTCLIAIDASNALAQPLPSIVSVGALTNTTTVGLWFNNQMDPGTADTAANYKVTGATVSSAVLLTNNQLVVLTLDKPVAPGATVQVSGVQDVNAKVVNSTNLPIALSALMSADVGTTNADGTFSDPAFSGEAVAFASNAFEVVAGGSDIWNNQDGFHFLYQPVTGDFAVSVRVASLAMSDFYAKAGLMIRESLYGGSRDLSWVPHPAAGHDSVDANYRAQTDGGTAGWPGANDWSPVPYPNCWIRLTRQGDTFTAWSGTNGVDWVQNAQMTVSSPSYPATVLVGLCVTAHNNSVGVYTVAEYDDFLVQTFLPTPVVVSAGAFAQGRTVGLEFEGPLDSKSADAVTNYVVSGATVQSAVLQTNGQVVVLTLDKPVAAGATVLVQGVQSAGGSGPILPTTLAIGISPLLSTDVGTTNASGAFSDPVQPGTAYPFASDALDVISGGSDIWNNADGFHFVYQQVTGDFAVSVRVASLAMSDFYAKAGLMIRESLYGGSRDLSWVAHPAAGHDSVDANYRAQTDGGTAGWPGANDWSPVPYPNAWIRLTRQGNTFTALSGTNGMDWVQNAQMTVTNTPYPATVLVGLCTTAHNNSNGIYTVAEYDQFSVELAGSLVSAGAFTNSSVVGVEFNKQLDPTSADAAANYTVSGATVESAELQTNGQTVLLTLNGPVAPGATVRVQGLGDLSGFTVPTATTTIALVSNFFSADIGSTNADGSFSDPIQPGTAYPFASDGFEVISGGSDIWNNADGFHFVYQPVTGDFAVSARVMSLVMSDFYAKGGLMIRESLYGGSRDLSWVPHPAAGHDSVDANYRAQTDGGTTGWPGANDWSPVPYPNCWIKLTRQGDTFTAWACTDGVAWVQRAQMTVTNPPYPATVLAGLCATAHNNNAGVYTVAMYDHVSIGPLVAPPGPSLVIAESAAGLTISWPSAAGSGVILQSTGSLTPPIVWTPANLPITTNGSMNTVVVPLGPGPKFFALSK
jgi:regulation of enolase protein 1 (concanavalin A-like superfamily)